MCKNCNKPDNPPSVVFLRNNILIFQRKSTGQQHPYVHANLEHRLILTLCCCRNLVALVQVPDGVKEPGSTPAYKNKCFSELRALKLAQMVFSPETVTTDIIPSPHLGEFLNLIIDKWRPMEQEEIFDELDGVFLAEHGDWLDSKQKIKTMTEKDLVYI